VSQSNPITPIEVVPRLTQLQFQILDALMDDAESVKQIFLAVNWKWLEAGSRKPRHSMKAIIEELNFFIEKGYAEAPKSCNPTMPQPLDRARLHDYWFGLTEKGKQAWEAYKASVPDATR
jgi:hypothetical protein